MRFRYFQMLGIASSSAGVMLALWALVKGSCLGALVGIALELYGVVNFLAALCLYREETELEAKEAAHET